MSSRRRPLQPEPVRRWRSMLRAFFAFAGYVSFVVLALVVVGLIAPEHLWVHLGVAVALGLFAALIVYLTPARSLRDERQREVPVKVPGPAEGEGSTADRAPALVLGYWYDVQSDARPDEVHGPALLRSFNPESGLYYVDGPACLVRGRSVIPVRRESIGARCPAPDPRGEERAAAWRETLARAAEIEDSDG